MMGRSDAMLESWLFRGEMISAGAVGFAFGVYAIVRVLRRMRNSGRPLLLEPPEGRVIFQMSAGFSLLSLLALVMGVLGPAFKEVDIAAFGGFGGVGAILWIWAEVEMRWAWPGILVVPEARDDEECQPRADSGDDER